jgi:hypothetical protein
VRGQDWGEIAPVPADAVWVADDAEASSVIEEARRAGHEVPPLCLVGGDLARTLGGRGDRERLLEHGGTHVRVDLGAALVDGHLHWFVAHLVARGPWLRGRIVVAANAAFIGSWNIAPRAHPGDGRLDILDGDLPFGDRLRARRRLPAGTHVPHPAIDVRRTAAAQFDFRRPTRVFLDGRSLGPASSVSVRLEPAAVDVWV